MAVCVLWLKAIFGTMDVLGDGVAMDVVAVEILVKRLLAALGMTIGAPLRTRTQKAAKILFYTLHRKKKGRDRIY